MHTYRQTECCRRRFWHATHDCVAPYADIILHRGRFWAKSAASGSVRWCCVKSCWTVLSHVMRGRPSCLLQSARGEANRILLASALRIICPNRVSRRDWIIAVSLGCFVSLHTSSFHTNWNALNLIISCCKSVAYHLWQYIYITATTTAAVAAGTRVKKILYLKIICVMLYRICCVDFQIAVTDCSGIEKNSGVSSSWDGTMHGMR